MLLCFGQKRMHAVHRPQPLLRHYVKVLKVTYSYVNQPRSCMQDCLLSMPSLRILNLFCFSNNSLHGVRAAKERLRLCFIHCGHNSSLNTLGGKHARQTETNLVLREEMRKRQDIARIMHNASTNECCSCSNTIRCFALGFDYCICLSTHCLLYLR
jgi:hypothetical protein